MDSTNLGEPALKSEEPRSEVPPLKSSPSPTPEDPPLESSPSPTPAVSWVRPKGSNGRRPTKVALVESMDIDYGDFNSLHTVAIKSIMQAMVENERLLNAERWDRIHENTRLDLHRRFCESVKGDQGLTNSKTWEKTDNALKDPKIVDYFTNEAWVASRRATFRQSRNSKASSEPSRLGKDS